MTEYIGYLDEDHAPVVDMAQEVVRCRDCVSYVPAWNGCTEFGDESRGEYANVEPDGYCAWACRKE